MNAYNLAQLADTNYSYYKNFESQHIEHYDNDKVSDKYLGLIMITKELRSTYIAPAYHYNRYQECQNQFLVFQPELTGTEHNARITDTQITLQIEFHATLYSIKMLLDRVVPMFAEWYTGIRPKMPFGGIDTNGKGVGFMKFVFDHHKQNAFFAWVLDEYRQWIQSVAKPRNLITHEKDLTFMYRLDGDMSSPTAEITPVHMIKGPEHARNWSDTEPLDVKDLQVYIDRLYAFFDATMTWFAENPTV